MKRPLSLLPALVAFVFPFVTAQACGPSFEPDIFVHKAQPDHPADYYAGKLGILLPTYSRADLIVAWRYLNGAPLTPEEQKAHQTDDANQAKLPESSNYAYGGSRGPADEWLAARNRYAPAQPEVQTVKDSGMAWAPGYVLASSYENCQADAFRNAVLTLNSRAGTWGAKSPELADWIHGQDAVYSNCGGLAGAAIDDLPAKIKITPTAPSPAPANAPALLRQDRAYQIAAANFYAGEFALARDSFQAIAGDHDSPWRGIAAYLVARTLIRESFLTAKPDPSAPSSDEMAAFDPDLMRQAQQQLESLRNQNLPGISPHAIQNMLNLVRIRTEPKARLREIADALSGPKPDPDYMQDLDDLIWCLDTKAGLPPDPEDAWDQAFHVERSSNDQRPLTSGEKKPGLDQVINNRSDFRAISPLIDWFITFQSPADGARRHAIAQWKGTSNSAWLTVAIMKASADDPETPALLEAASRIPTTSPAWATIFFHHIRLLIETGQAAQARTELASAFPSIQALRSDSDLNLFTGLRMRTAPTLDEALADAPRRILDRTSIEQASLDECLTVMHDPKRQYDCRKDNSPVEFSDDAVALFNGEMPLTTLAQTAQSNALPPQLRQSVAIMTWVRSVLLNNEAVAAAMLPLLPQKLQQQAGTGIGFHPLMAILRNPGLRPYLDRGVQRSASYDFVESYADNWWCNDWTANFTAGAPALPPPVAFLSPQIRETGAKEAKALLALGSAEVYLGSQVLDYARAHPSDPDLPEALYLTLRTIRYGCFHGIGNSDSEDAAQVGSIAREVGAILRRDYSTNPWTRKAAPYVWPAKKEG